MAKVMYNGQEVEAIDVTPTWGNIVFDMLNNYVRLSVDHGCMGDPEDKRKIENLEIEFRRMAIAADRWVEQRKGESCLLAKNAAQQIKKL